MFIGHFGVAFAAKRACPRMSLGTFVLASQFIDLLWPILILLGIEDVRIVPGATEVTPLEFVHYPWTHSLLMVLVWSALLGLPVYLYRRSRRAGVVVGGLVLSHWVLDFLAHEPDLPLVPGVDYAVGLGLWNAPIVSMVVEAAIFVLGVALYVRMTKPKDRAGLWSLWSFVGLLAIVWAASMVTGMRGQAPPDERAVAWAGLATWLFVPWGYWIDRHRIARNWMRSA